MTFLMSKKLKYFVVSYEVKCINIAAEQLCITRSPLVRVLYDLEERIGDKLFTRKYNELIATPLGIELYEQIKPIYDLHCNIESEFCLTKQIPKFELLCDFSVPYALWDIILSKMNSLQSPVGCRRISASCGEIQSLLSNPNVAILSFRKITIPSTLFFHKIKDEKLCLVYPDRISRSDLIRFNVMNKINLYIRKNSFSHELKIILSRELSTFLPYLNIRETDHDTASIMVSVTEGNGMVLLPECIADHFSPPKTSRVIIPDISMQCGVIYNPKNKNREIVKEIISVLNPIMNF